MSEQLISEFLRARSAYKAARSALAEWNETLLIELEAHLGEPTNPQKSKASPAVAEEAVAEEAVVPPDVEHRLRDGTSLADYVALYIGQHPSFFLQDLHDDLNLKRFYPTSRVLGDALKRAGAFRVGSSRNAYWTTGTFTKATKELVEEALKSAPMTTLQLSMKLHARRQDIQKVIRDNPAAFMRFGSRPEDPWGLPGHRTVLSLDEITRIICIALRDGPRHIDGLYRVTGLTSHQLLQALQASPLFTEEEPRVWRLAHMKLDGKRAIALRIVEEAGNEGVPLRYIRGLCPHLRSRDLRRAGLVQREGVWLKPST